MTPRHHRRAARSSVLFVALLVAAAAARCSETKQATPPAHTLGEFCAPLQKFYATEFDVTNSEITYVGQSAGLPVTDIAAGDNEICTFSTNVLLNPVRADARLVRHKNDHETAPSPQWLKSERFSPSPLPGHSADVWFRDSRIKKPGNTKGIAFLITQAGVWSGELTVTNESDMLAMTDGQVNKAADALLGALAAIGH